MPTTIMLEGVGGLVLCLAMAVLGIYFYGRHQRDIGYEEGRCDQYTALGELAEMAELHEIDQRGDGHQPGRHERTQPRTLPPAPTFTPAEQRPPWYTEIPGAVQLPRGGAIGVMLKRAADAIPGPDRIQPGRDSGAGTITFDRVQLDTGEFRALSEQDIAQRSADNAAWLEKWSAEAAS